MDRNGWEEIRERILLVVVVVVVMVMGRGKVMSEGQKRKAGAMYREVCLG